MNLFLNRLTRGMLSGLTPARIASLLCLFVLFLIVPCQAHDLPPSKLSQAEIMRLGEQMYRNGILPSGKVMEAYIRGDVEVDSSAFSCSSCHLRAGLGSFEGGVVTPPTTGLKLYKPYHRPPSLGDVEDRAGRFIYAKTVQERPAYTRETLRQALRGGVDPAGQVFNDVMPRYPLDDRDMEILIRYLEGLSSHPSPGISLSKFKFATIITDDVSPEDRRAFLGPLQWFVEQKNAQMDLYNDYIKFGFSPTIDMKYAFQKASLDVWELKGPPETWQQQLVAYYNKKPVFAILSGISNRDWRPIHDFCETNRIPCLFPITDFPVVSSTSWYTYYYNKGYYQEGEAVANYLNGQENLPADTSVLQIVQDSDAGKALLSGFQSSWNSDGRRVTTLALSSSQLQSRSLLKKLVKQYRPGILLLWTDARVLPFLPELASGLASPGKLFLSSTLLGKKTTLINDSVRNKVYLTFPYRLTPYVGTRDSNFDAVVPIEITSKVLGDRRIVSRTITMLKQTTLRGLNLMLDNLYRDHLLDIMSTQMDQVVPDYERFSFGPGQRYVSKGCYIIQLGPGPAPALLARSGWVIH